MSMYSLQTSSGIPVTIDAECNDPTAESTVEVNGALVYSGALEHDHEQSFTVSESRRGIVRLRGSGPFIEVEIFGDGKAVLNRDGSITLSGGMKQP